jgi:hypothetical protein
MARIRSIKPEFRTSQTVTQWPREVRLFWALLWGYLDDHGYGLDDPKLIKADCFPVDDDLTAADIDKWLDLIAGTVVAEFDPPPLCRYEFNGRRFLHAVKWAEHQRPQHPAIPKFPPCPSDHLMSVSGESHEMVSGESHETFGGAGSLNGENPAQAGERESHETLSPEQVVKQVVEQGGVAVTREARSRAATTLLGNAILDEHKRLCHPAPPRDVLRRVGEIIDSLLDDPAISATEIREGLRRLRGNRKWGPGMLPTLVDEIRREAAGQGDPVRSRVPTTDQRMAAIQALKDPPGSQPENVIPGSVIA